uniref:Uncharacterized protein n=1 Tax=Meloidogyne enterolobii TaxID=390850 RepID=A0A6V7TWH9_MELEN|nr:unnamed protein product [Meloidogyne enterolobii]
MFKQKMDIDEFYQRFWLTKSKADSFLATKKGALLRVGVIGVVTAAYPIANLLMSGPLLSALFPWRYKVSNELPDRLKKTIEQQSFFWLEKEGRGESDTFFSFTCQLDAKKSFDSIRIGTLASPTGAQIALPFYVKFKNEQEALEYAKQNLEPFNILGKTACIIWESEVGKQILSTFVLSDEALAFLVARDLYAVQKPYLLTQEALTYFCHVLTFMLCFYALHVFAFRGDSLVFAVALPILAGIAIYAAVNWNKLGIFMNECHADIMAANLSVLHTKGGQEYYMKFLSRNRILRDLLSGGDKLFSPIGEVKRSIAKYVSRYDGINDVSSNNDQLTLSILGDDYS